MRAFIEQTIAELRIFARNRQTVFFTVAFPMLMMVMFGSMGTSDWRGTGGTDYMPFLLGGIIGMAVLSSAFENLSQNLVKEREMGILKRLGGTPLSRSTILSSKILSAAVIILLQVVVLVAVGVAFFGIEVGGKPLELLGILALGIAAFTSLGFALACLVRSTSTASVASHAAYIPMLFACGAFFPMEATPEILQEAAKFLPLTYFLDPLRDTIGGGGLLEGNLVAIGVLLLWMIAGFAVSVRMFRWE
jgi:ABC-2 type transport system permease protein